MCISYADLILDQSTGIVVRPLSLLSTDIGLKTLVNATNALSLQYERCWVVLYAQPEIRYLYVSQYNMPTSLIHWAGALILCQVQKQLNKPETCSPHINTFRFIECSGGYVR